jgi:hypothetical protein
LEKQGKTMNHDVQMQTNLDNDPIGGIVGQTASTDGDLPVNHDAYLYNDLQPVETLPGTSLQQPQNSPSVIPATLLSGNPVSEG